MKTKITVIFLWFFATGCSKETNEFDLEYKQGKWYRNNMLYTGDVYRVINKEKIHLGKVLMGNKEGHWTEFGQIIFRNGKYNLGKKEGEWSGWYADSSKAYRGIYKDNSKHGLWRGWNKNGTLSYEGTYKIGKKDSLWSYWYPNGTLSDSGFYDQDKLSGKWKYYNSEGVLVEEKIFP